MFLLCINILKGCVKVNERIKEIRKYLGLSMEKFGVRLGVTKMTISRIEGGVNNVTDQMFLSICREFNVNPEWLKNGTGEMFNQLSNDERLAKIVGNVLQSDDQFIKNVYIALGEAPDEFKKMLKEFLKKCLDNIDVE